MLGESGSLFTAGGLAKAFVRIVVVTCILALLSVGLTFMASNIGSPATAFAFHSSLVDQGPSPSLGPGATTTYTMRFRNIGLVPWQRGGHAQVNLGIVGDSTRFADEGIAVGWLNAARPATTTEQIVLPGMIGTFTFTVRAPSAPGIYHIPLRPVVDGLTWLEDDKASLVLTSDLGFHSQLVDQALNPTLKPGQLSDPLTLRFRNTGARTWTRGVVGQQVNLGILADDKSMGGLAAGWPTLDRVAIQNESFVAPSAVGTFTFRVRAPLTPGIYPLRLRPVVDGLTWLEDEGVVTLITVMPASGVMPPVQDEAFKNVQPPSFTVTASASPTSLTAGAQVSITATFVTPTAGTAVIGVGIFAPGHTSLVYQQWLHNESFAAGESRTYQFAWTVPTGAATGSYVVYANAFSTGWKFLLGSNYSAASFDVVASPTSGGPQPTPTATVAPTAAPPVGTPAPTAAPSAVPTATSAPTAAPTATPAPTVAPTPTASTAPAPTPAPSFTLASSVTPASVAQGGSVNITSSATSATAVTAIIDVQVYAPSATTSSYQVYYQDQTFTAGQQLVYPTTWAVPLSAVTGTYKVVVRAYSPGWTTLYSVKDPAATFAVTAAPSPTPSPTPAPTPAPTANPTPTPAPTAAPLGYRGNASNSAASGLSLALNVPAGVQNGDLLVATVTDWPGTLTGPSGWTRALLPSANQGIWYKVASNEPASYTWSGSADSTWSGVIDAFSGVSTATPLDATPLAIIGTAATVAWPGAISVTDKAWSLVVSTENNNTDTIAVPSGYTARSAMGGNSFIRSSTRVISPAGTVAPSASDSSGTPTWSAYSLVLRPAGGAGPTGAPAPTPTPGPTPVPTPAPTPVPTATPAPVNGISPLHVQGNKLLNGSGQTVVIHGVNHSGTEYACSQGWGIFDGQVDSAAVAAIKAWPHINAVRVPMNEDCWLGINGVPGAYAGANYQNALKNYVNLLNSNGLYAILDLHWNAPGGTLANSQQVMADSDHSPTFWTQVANAYKGNNAVIFELYNEPHDISWSCWRDGGSCASFQVAGMQTLVNAVRNTGATNVLLLGGLDWSNDISSWLSYKPNDPQNGIAAAWHVYDFNGCMDVNCYNSQGGPVVASVPLVVTETNSNSCNATWWNALFNWLDAHGAGYTPWTWNTWGTACSDKSLISDYSGTPSTSGQQYKNHLAGLP